MADLVAALPEAPADLVAGLRLRTLDGNFLAGTEHRLAAARQRRRRAARHELVVRDDRTGLLTDLVPREDAYTNERAPSRGSWLVRPGDLWLADRNFCTDDQLAGIATGGPSS